MRTADENPTEDAFYISLVGSYKNGTARHEPFIYDLITKEVGMKNILAKPIDVTDLIKYFNQNHPEFEIVLDKNIPKKHLQLQKKSRSPHGPPPSEITTYELTTFFIKNETKKNPKSNFVLDEVPIMQQGT